MGELFLNAKITGIDLSAIQPDWVPKNVKFHIDDAESSWVRENKYNFIFARYLAASIGDWLKLVENACADLNPNGWAEFPDCNLLFDSDDGTLTDEYETLHRDALACDVCKMVGREPNPGPELYRWVTEARFQNVAHKHYKIPIGPWAKELHYKDIGTLNLVQMLEGLEGFTLKPFCGVFGWSTKEVHMLLAEVRREMTPGAFHAYMNFHVVYGHRVRS